MDLVQIVDAAMAEAVARGGRWIACMRGCAECCLGTFDITPDDAARVRAGVAQLDDARRAAIAERVAHYKEGDDEPCPLLDPDRGLCEIYEHRPLMCRTFGPATQIGESIGVCHLCFNGATDEQVAATAVELRPEWFDSPTPTTVAQALADVAFNASASSNCGPSSD